MTPFRCCGICKHLFYCKFPAQSNSERIKKISVIIWRIYEQEFGVVFSESQCISKCNVALNSCN